jgi:hypothetical protein
MLKQYNVVADTEIIWRKIRASGGELWLGNEGWPP